ARAPCRRFHGYHILKRWLTQFGRGHPSQELVEGLESSAPDNVAAPVKARHLNARSSWMGDELSSTRPAQVGQGNPHNGGDLVGIAPQLRTEVKRYLVRLYHDP